MLIQPITSHYSYSKIQSRNSVPTFKGELGVKVLKEITVSGAKDSAGIAGVLKKLGLGFLGLISISKLKDILEPFVSRFNNFEEEMKNKENGLRAQELIFEADKKAFQEEIESQKQAFEEEMASQKQAFEADKKAHQKELASQKQAFEADKKAQQEKLSKRMEELAKKENALNNVEHLLRQGEIDELKSSIMVAYGIVATTDVKSYDSAGEQTLQVIDIINKNKKPSAQNGVSVENMDEDNIARLVRTMRNKDGKITPDMLNTLRKITAMHDYDMDRLIPIMLVLKDNFGEIDFNKMAYFIALYSLEKATITSVAKNLVKEYNMSDEMFINILKNISSNTYYSKMIGYANLLSECDVTGMQPETKQTALKLINKKLNVIDYDKANEYGKETHKILKDLAEKLG